MYWVYIADGINMSVSDCCIYTGTWAVFDLHMPLLYVVQNGRAEK